ncbi:plastocyanin/azurin family copper-binding protein [Miltoncostaea oceani]|uniref:plastocyanin/azurin family copper-binding protein n=1 Tax=Miltoncostaea oceani TaxID=2843216 RepID=UPI001C3D72E8|nr:plastocyanin/azurin family copper-binding protein [Miltoncostaea oceani]
MPRITRFIMTAAAIAALGLGLSACGGDDDSSDAPATPDTTTEQTTTAAGTSATTAPAPAAGSTLEVDADPSGALAFTQTTLSTTAGPVTITLRNESPVPHNIAVRGGSVDTEPSETIQGGETTELTVDLPPGEYEYYCEVPGHEQAGMKGTLTVE